MELFHNKEKGQVFMAVLVMLALGSLLVVPLLSLASTALGYRRIMKRKALEIYSADSGIEYALCQLGNNPELYQGVSLDETFSINGKTVDVTLQYYVDEDVYKVVSTATSDDGSSTTIESYLEFIDDYSYTRYRVSL